MNRVLNSVIRRIVCGARLFGCSAPALILLLILLLLLCLAPRSAFAQDPGDPFKACGTITGGVSCPTFSLDGGGMVLISDLGGYPPDTRAYVEGTYGGSCGEICLFLIPVPCVQVSLIRLCDPPAFLGCGTINGGPGCPTFLADTGTLYFLSDLGGYESGARVRVSGTLGGSCPSLCDIAAPCITVEKLDRCARDVADYDDSGCTDVSDFLYLLDHWQQPLDGTPVDIDDFLALLDNWYLGAGC